MCITRVAPTTSNAKKFRAQQRHAGTVHAPSQARALAKTAGERRNKRTLKKTNKTLENNGRHGTHTTNQGPVHPLSCRVASHPTVSYRAVLYLTLGTSARHRVYVSSLKRTWLATFSLTFPLDHFCSRQDTNIQQ